ncbi:unnamed protein product [Medioppia subpectinata]|uniref:Adenylate cyclase N-terminal domain-containing protein n=1 Tax=Medioppia subpectinata TaxID=1979941 RepID=A0A7R9KP00_9ACAR|nr:unnamed protein product [Medioppia subpectinata]CAG2107094.1 unnamed protein product [Medioppia subpectinata]
MNDMLCNDRSKVTISGQQDIGLQELITTSDKNTNTKTKSNGKKSANILKQKLIKNKAPKQCIQQSDGKSASIPSVSISPVKHSFGNCDIINGKLEEVCETLSDSSPSDTAVDVVIEGADAGDDGTTPTHYFTTSDDWSVSWKGILLPKLTNDFKDAHLEASYQRYSHRQRQKSLLILNVIDILLKLSLLIIYAISDGTPPADGSDGGDATDRLKYRILYNIPWFAINASLIALITCWKQFANNYLHLGAIFTWVIFNIQGQIGFGIELHEEQLEIAVAGGAVWHILFIVFVTYAMMPLPLRWCVICGAISSLMDLILETFLNKANGYNNTFIRMITANALLYTCINLVSLYTKYLTDCAQRNAFLETRRSIETRYKIEKENGKQP